MIRITVVALIALVSVQAQVRVRPGMWENTISGEGKSATRSACKTTADTAAANGPVASVRAAWEKSLTKGGACSLKDFKLEGNTQTDVMVCGKRILTNTTTYHNGDSFEWTSSRTDSGVSKVTTIKSRRTGDCP